MIQRIQSFYLLMTTILSGLFLSGSIFKFSNEEGSELMMNFRGIYEIAADKNYALAEQIVPVFLVAILVPLISLLAIFLFKKRKLQLKVTLILIIAEALLIAYTAYYVISSLQHSPGTMIPGFRLFIPLITIILSLMAYRGIRNDENLVKSYDRLR